VTEVGVVSLEVSSNGVDFTTSQQQFVYVAPVSVLGVNPTSGPISGGTDIMLSVEQGFPSVPLNCVYNGKTFPVSKINATMWMCRTVPLESLVRSKKSMIQLVYKDIGEAGEFPFFVYENPSISSVVPSSASELGGQQVIVHGSGFFQSASLSCLFDGTAVKGKYVSPTSIICDSPAHQPMSTFLRVSLNGRDYSSTRLPFRFTTQATVTKVFPLSSIRGSEQLISVYGTSFTDNDQAYCVFGDNYVLSHTIINGSAILCQPPTHLEGDVVLDVSINGKSVTGSGAVIKFLSPPHLDSCFPLHGPLSGGTILHLYGSEFVEGNMFCRFGGRTVTANYISNSHVTCVAPSQNKAERIQLGISVNGVHFMSSGLYYEYVEEIEVSSVEPNFGPESGGTTVVLKGKHFGPRGQMVCEFGSSNPVRVSAVRLSNNSVSCVTPGQMPGLVSIKIGFVGQVCTSNSAFFYFQEREVVSGIFPNIGYTFGGSEIVVSGLNFRKNLKALCRFGKENVLAMFVSSREL
jgi:hypothetical protein